MEELFENVGALFYLVNPYKTFYEKIEDIPKPYWVARCMPYMLSLILLEFVILIWKQKAENKLRINDGLMSLSHGLLLLVRDVFLRGVFNIYYIYIYENYRIYELPWDSIWTWLIAMLAIDFGYYWVHRAAHEVAFLWCGHQVHHSSEDYVLTTAMRQSVFQEFGAWPFYLPLAFAIPPTHKLVHDQFNLLYQFWIHTELIGNLGPLEYILNTSTHHRVHHGSNPYCIDKNYGGFLIIWDRMFGTFASYRPHEKLVYGLIDQPQFFNPIRHQLFYFGLIIDKVKSMKTWKNKVLAAILSPGWGYLENDKIPDRTKYDPPISIFVNIYVLIHFFLIFMTFETFDKIYASLSGTASLTFALYILGSLTVFGLIFDLNERAWLYESLRCVIFLIAYNSMASLDIVLFHAIPQNLMNVFFVFSFILAAFAYMTRKTKIVKFA